MSTVWVMGTCEGLVVWTTDINNAHRYDSEESARGQTFMQHWLSVEHKGGGWVICLKLAA